MNVVNIHKKNVKSFYCYVYSTHVRGTYKEIKAVLLIQFIEKKNNCFFFSIVTHA